MKINRFYSSPPGTPYAPSWDFSVGTSFCKNVNSDSLSKFLLERESSIKKLKSNFINGKLVDGNTGLGKNSTTTKFQNYNILTWNHSEIKNLKKYICENLIEYNQKCGHQMPPQLWIQCWYNVLRFNQSIKPHSHSRHSYSYLSGHFNVQTNKTSTVYMSPINQINNPDVIDIKNKNNEMTIFPSYIFHYTTPHYSLKPRITIAFDIRCEQPTSNWILL